MIAFVLAAALAVPAAADTAIRVPGMSLRFGMTEERAQAHGALATVTPPDARGMVARQGAMAFFGVKTQATLYFAGGHLSRVSVTADSVSEHSQDYIEDELRRSGLRPSCTKHEPADRQCDWMGHASAHVEMHGGHVTAKLEPVVAASAAAPVAAAAAPPITPALPPGVTSPPAHAMLGAPTPTIPVAAAPATVPVVPDTLDFTRAGAADSLPKPVIVTKCTPVWPAAARKAGLQGRVLVRALVDTTGHVVAAGVTRSVPGLDLAAMNCARATSFKAYLLRGRAVPFWIEIPVLFLLY